MNDDQLNSTNIPPAIWPVRRRFPAGRIWICTSLVLAIGSELYFTLVEGGHSNEWQWLVVLLLITLCAAIGSLPVLIVLFFVTLSINHLPLEAVAKIRRLVLLCFGCTLPYAIFGAGIFTSGYNNPHYLADNIIYGLLIIAALFSSSVVAMLVNKKAIIAFFSQPDITQPVRTTEYFNETYPARLNGDN